MCRSLEKETKTLVIPDILNYSELLELLGIGAENSSATPFDILTFTIA